MCVKSYPKQPLIYHSSHSKGWCTATSSVRSDSFMGLGWRLQSEEIPQKLKFLPKDTLPSSENISQHKGDVSSPFFGNSKASSRKPCKYSWRHILQEWLWLPFLLSFITSVSYFLWNSVHLLPFTTWPSCEHRNEQLGKKEECAVSPHWHVSGTEPKRKVLIRKTTFPGQSYT